MNLYALMFYNVQYFRFPNETLPVKGHRYINKVVGGIDATGTDT